MGEGRLGEAEGVGGLGTAGAFPGVEAEVMVVAVGGEKARAVAEPLQELGAEGLVVE